MAPTKIKHQFVSGVNDGGAASKVQPQRDWNADHVVELSPALAPLDSLVPAPDRLAYYVDANNAALTAFTALARSLIGKVTEAEMTTLLNALSLGGGTMTGHITLAGTPVSPLHPATKQYVDSLLSGFKPKQSVRAASPAATNIDVASAPASLDNVAGVAGDRWALLHQTAPAENGIYTFVAAGSPLERADDFDEWTEIPGAQFLVEEGDTRADTGWVSTANQGGTLGVTAITFTQYFGPGLFQPAHANLTTLAGLASVVNLSALANLAGAADKLAYFTGAGAMTLADLSVFARTLLDDADAAAARGTLGLGTAAVKNFGTAANQLVELDGAAKLPAVDGSQLTNLPIAAARNLIINGRFDIDQRGGGAALGVTDNVYGPDRWRYVGETSGTVHARRNDISATRFNVSVVPTGTNSKFGLFQIVEAADCKHLRNTNVVLSATLAVANVAIGNVRMAVIQSTATDDTQSADPISAWNGDGVAPTLAASWSYVGGAASANLGVGTVAAAFSFAPGVCGNFNNLAVLIWNDDKAHSNEALYITDVKLEAGVTVTPYEPEPFSVLMEKCQRFYEKTYDHLTVPGTVTNAGALIAARNADTSSQSRVMNWRYAVHKRITVPAVTVYSPGSGAVGNMSDEGSTTDVAASYQNNGQSGCSMYNTAATVAGVAYRIHGVANAEI